MKTRLSLTICLAILISASSALAQDINGLKFEKEYTRSQIIKALGTPDKNSGEYSLLYGQSYINVEYVPNSTKLYLESFYVDNPRFITMTEEIEGGLRVGDDISKVKKTKCQIIESKPDYICYWYYGDWAEWSIDFDKKGKITGIGFTILN